MAIDHDEKPESHETWNSSTDTFREELEDVCLNEDAKAPAPLPPGTRPDVLTNIVHECFFVALIAFAAASSVFLQRSMIVVAADINKSLDMSPAETAWVSGASGLTTGAFLIPFGHLADICPVLSRKYLLIISLTAFSLIVAFTSFANSGIVIDIMSGLAGLACAATIPIAVGILSLVYPEPSRRKNIVFSSFLMGNPAAIIVGGLGTGGVASSFSWKATFIFLGILYAIVTVLSWWIVPNIAESRSNSKLRRAQQCDVVSPFVLVSKKIPNIGGAFQKFDWTGLFLLVTGVLMFTVALTVGPEGPQPWKTPTVILLLTLGLLFLGSFIMWESSAKRPMIPPAIWENTSVVLVNVSALTSAMAYYPTVFWITMFLQKIQGLEPFDVAVRLLPQALVGIFFSPLVGLIMDRISGTILLIAAASCSVLSNLLLVFLDQDTNYFALIFPSLLLSTIGMDWTMNVGSLYTLSVLPLEHHSIGASLLQTTLRLGLPLGLGVTTAVWTSLNGQHDPTLPYTKTFIVTTAFAGFSLLLAPFIRIGQQGVSQPQSPKEENSDKYRPSKRWSYVETISSSTSSSSSSSSPTSRNSPKPELPPIRTSSFSSELSIEKNRNSSRDTAASEGPKSKIVWVVCEQCNASRRVTDSVGDPTKYFNNIYGTLEKPNHDMIVNGRRRFPLAVRNPRLNSNPTTASSG
ncbi:hypothetical protein E8E14_007059 [Neopestalotiopsis sp. 37M]|nr:hypothetical protein E8E14_007059 [Neopestalotiopsis sp. 37M]